MLHHLHVNASELQRHWLVVATPAQRHARSRKCDESCVGCRAPVSSAAGRLFQCYSLLSSLPAERACAQVKRSEAPRLCHVATAPRNQVQRRFLADRLQIIEQAEQAAATLRKLPEPTFTVLLGRWILALARPLDLKQWFVVSPGVDARVAICGEGA